jgi:hypothetical protein
MSNFTKTFEEAFQKEFEEQKAAIKKPNLAVVGGTGVGKSSLINRIFGKNVAKAGAGIPVTKGMNKIEDPSGSVPIVFYDTEGYETTSANEQNNTNFEQNIIPEFEKLQKKNLDEQIHIVWYCISIANHRVTPYDIKNIKYFKDNGYKVAIVFTKCDTDEELGDGSGKDANAFKGIIKEKIGSMDFFETTNDESMKLDVDALLEWSAGQLGDEMLRQSFIMAQISSIELKKQEAHRVVHIAATTTAATAGLNPVPISDALLIAPQQIAMCVKIANIFWLNTGSALNLEELLKAQLLQIVGKAAAASLTKLIPVLGQLINAAVAGGLTYGFGFAITEANAMALNEFLKTGKMPVWAEVFNSKFIFDIMNKAKDQFKG